MLEVLCLRDALPYSCLLLRGVICCWSIPAANYSNPCASSTCIWELKEAGEWGTEGFGLCLTICLVKHWYYLVSFPPTLQCMMQGKLRWLWSFIVLTVLSVKHNSICSFLWLLQFTTIQEFLKTQWPDPAPLKAFLHQGDCVRLNSKHFKSQWKKKCWLFFICVASQMPNNTALHVFITLLCKWQDPTIARCTKWVWQVTSRPLHRLHFHSPFMVAVYLNPHFQLLAW